MLSDLLIQFVSSFFDNLVLSNSEFYKFDQKLYLDSLNHRNKRGLVNYLQRS